MDQGPKNINTEVLTTLIKVNNRPFIFAPLTTLPLDFTPSDKKVRTNF